ATASRSSIKRGLGQRPADSTSARAMSIPARIARTRGLSADSRDRTSASERDNDCAPASDGITAIARAAQGTTQRITTSSERLNRARARSSGLASPEYRAAKSISNRFGQTGTDPSDQLRRWREEGRGRAKTASEVHGLAPHRRTASPTSGVRRKRFQSRPG